MPLEIEEVSLSTLMKDASRHGNVRGGATINPEKRASGYAREGYGGTMVVARTGNMRDDEDALLERGNFRHNKQGLSNVKAKAGYVYVIKGKKKAKKRR